MSGAGRVNAIHFIPPGPVAAAWVDDSTTPMPFIQGPAGSGKTTSAVFKGPRWLIRNMPVCKDGVIRGRLTVIRDNYRRLAETALKSWKLVFNEDLPYSEFSGGQDRPVHHKLELMVRRNGVIRKCEIEVDFFAVGDHAIEEMLRGYETSAGWGNEVDLLQERVLPFLYSRTGRYPSRMMLPDELVEKIEKGEFSVPRQVFGDLNPPDYEHWTQKWDRDGRDGFKLYKQPSGLSAQAENRKGKSLAEYEADLRVMDEYDARRFVHGLPGYSRDGIPVYGEFREHDHVRPLTPDPALPISIGFDAGGEPACAIAQAAPNGQFRVLREIVTEPITGAARFSELLLAMLQRDFHGFSLGPCFGDPSAFYGADRMNGELAWMETVALAIGHNIEPAPSNEPGIRIDAVKLLLKNRLDAHIEAFAIDPSCSTLIAGFIAHYKLGKDNKGNVTNGGRPVKNRHSHVHDALQYVALGLRGRAGVVQDSARAGRAGNVVPIISGRRPKSDFDVWNV